MKYKLTIMVIDDESKNLFGRNSENLIDILRLDFVNYQELKTLVENSFIGDKKTIKIKR